MAGRNVITRQALRPNDRTQNVDNGAAQLAKHQASIPGERRWRAEFHRPLVSE
jgi:hypothetical protein